MTPPDVLRKTRNVCGAVAASCAAVSYGAIQSMAWWLHPLDYWLAWVSGATLAATGACIVSGFVFHLTYLDSMRTN